MQNELWFRPLVWMDYRLGSIHGGYSLDCCWAFVQKAEAIQRLLTI